MIAKLRRLAVCNAMKLLLAPESTKHSTSSFPTLSFKFIFYSVVLLINVRYPVPVVRRLKSNVWSLLSLKTVAAGQFLARQDLLSLSVEVDICDSTSPHVLLFHNYSIVALIAALRTYR